MDTAGSRRTGNVSIAHAASDETLSMARELMREYIAWAFTLEEGSDKAPTFDGIEDELASLPGPYASPTGRLLVATADGRAAGCLCLKPRGDGLAELKRLYVRPDMRGLGIGRSLVEKLLAEARAEGYRKIILDSHISMKPAHAIYRAAGFQDVAPPDAFPEHLKPIVVFMERGL